jgi:hypothetical protein
LLNYRHVTDFAVQKADDPVACGTGFADADALARLLRVVHFVLLCDAGTLLIGVFRFLGAACQKQGGQQAKAQSSHYWPPDRIRWNNENAGVSCTLIRRRIEGYVATGRQKHGTRAATTKRKLKSGTLIARMSTKLKRAGYRSRYRLRKQIVEPVFGQIKQARGFRKIWR